MIDLEALSKTLLDTIKGYVGRSVSAVVARVAAVEQRLDALPVPKDGHTPTAEELQPLVADGVRHALASAWEKDWRVSVLGEVDAAVKQIPVPRDGRDGHTPTVEELQPLVAASVAEAVKQIPVPKDGQDGHTPTAEELQPLVAKALAEADIEGTIAEMVVNEVASGASAESLAPVIRPLLDEAIKAVPAAKDGHTPTAEELQPLVAAAVERQAKELEVRRAADAEAILTRISGVERSIIQMPAPRDGVDGRTPTVEELQPLVAASVDAAVKQIPAPRDGVDGRTPTAEELQPLVLSAVGKALPETVAHEVAKAVAEIPAAKDGEPGRDALDLHILPAIDADKSYPRGTYAKHRGGLWRSYEPTAAMRGWECIVDGIASLEVEQQGDRKFVVTMGLSGGTQQVKEFNLPVMIYRGVYREGMPYEAGDTVTWGGSTWTCKQATDVKPGDGVADWVLSVKKGRDAKPTEGVKT